MDRRLQMLETRTALSVSGKHWVTDFEVACMTLRMFNGDVRKAMAQIAHGEGPRCEAILRILVQAL